MAGGANGSEWLSASELQPYRDAEWALHDPEIQRRYEGQWVVAHKQRIIAHGSDARAVAAQASEAVPNQAHQLILCARGELDTWLTHATEGSVDFTDA